MTVVAPERLKERAEQYARTHPEASLAVVLGRFRLSPDEESEERRVVKDVLAGIERPDLSDADELGGAKA